MAGERILIVDDEPSIREMPARWLKFTGYEPSTAADALEGLEQFQQVRPDLVISDVLMPGMDDHEFCRQLRQSSDVSIILLTGLANLDEEKARVRSMDLAINAFLSKPLRLAEFTNTIESLLQGSRHNGSPN